MARKSRKQIQVVNRFPTESPMTVGYARLSVNDRVENQSIENQKKLISLWAKQHELPISKFYVDIGYSSSTFQRPAFQQLIQDISTGKIECVIVKDLSRVGRDHITVGYYIEEFFPLKNVRFVSVTDQFDTINGLTDQSSPKRSQIRIPLTNVFNEQAATDIKKKTAFALDIKAQRGIFIGPRAPFGYQKSEEKFGQIVADPEAAAIVQDIFKLFVDGMGITAIVRYLNENNIPTPIQYARSKELAGNYYDGNGSWNSRSVKYILTNRTYTGVLVQGKEKRVVAGTHEPLVDVKTFDMIQKQLQSKTFHLSDSSQGTENILKGKVTCGCCGRKMQRKRGTNHADWYFFTCNTNNRLGAGKCTGMYVREEDIFSAIYHQLKQYIQEHFITSLQYDEEIAQLKAKLNAQVEFRRTIAENPAMYYEQYVLGEISLDEFKVKQQKLRQAAEDQKAIELETEECEQAYRWFSRLCKVRDKELPLSTIMSEINNIVVDIGRKVVVQWIVK